MREAILLRTLRLQVDKRGSDKLVFSNPPPVIWMINQVFISLDFASFWCFLQSFGKIKEGSRDLSVRQLCQTKTSQRRPWGSVLTIEDDSANVVIHITGKE